MGRARSFDLRGVGEYLGLAQNVLSVLGAYRCVHHAHYINVAQHYLFFLFQALDSCEGHDVYLMLVQRECCW